MGVEPIISDL